MDAYAEFCQRFQTDQVEEFIKSSVDSWWGLIIKHGHDSPINSVLSYILFEKRLDGNNGITPFFKASDEFISLLDRHFYDDVPSHFVALLVFISFTVKERLFTQHKLSIDTLLENVLQLPYDEKTIASYVVAILVDAAEMSASRFDHQESYELALSAYDLLPSMKEDIPPKLIVRICSVISSSLLIFEGVEKASEVCKWAFQQVEGRLPSYDQSMLHLYFIRLHIFVADNDFESAEKIIAPIAPLLKPLLNDKVVDHQFVAAFLGKIGEAFFRARYFQRAEEYFKDSLEVMHEINSTITFNSVENHYALALAYFHQDKTIDSLKYLQIALNAMKTECELHLKNLTIDQLKPTIARFTDMLGAYVLCIGHHGTDDLSYEHVTSALAFISWSKFVKWWVVTEGQINHNHLSEASNLRRDHKRSSAHSMKPSLSLGDLNSISVSSEQNYTNANLSSLGWAEKLDIALLEEELDFDTAFLEFYVADVQELYMGGLRLAADERYRIVGILYGKLTNKKEYYALINVHSCPYQIIDKLATDYYKIMQNGSANPNEWDEDAECEAAKKLFSELLGKFEPSLWNFKKLIIATDGVVSLIPFSSLITTDGNRLLDKIDVINVNSFFDLAWRHFRSYQDMNDPVAFLNPYFDINTTDIEPGFENDFQSNREKQDYIVETELGLNLESQFVQQHWAGQVFKEGTADKKALLSIDRPQNIHLSTHGFYFEYSTNEELQDKESISVFEKTMRSTQNPLERCGLFTAGCNRVFRGKDVDKFELGYVTAQDLTKLDLRGTEFAFVATCFSGAGDQITGEGVYGIRISLKQAGCQNIIMSLWEADSKVALDIVKEFYQNIEENEPSQALRLAILKQIKNGVPAYKWANWIIFD